MEMIMMKKFISLTVAFLIFFSLGSSVSATVNASVCNLKLDKVYMVPTSAYGAQTFIWFIGKIKNYSKFKATIKLITINAKVVTNNGTYTYKKLFKLNPLKPPVSIPQIGKIVIPKTVNGKSFTILKVYDTTAQALIPISYLAQPFLASEYKMTNCTVDMTITAATTKSTLLRRTPSSSGKILKKLSIRTKIKVLSVVSKGFVKVKSGSLTGYVLEKYLK